LFIIIKEKRKKRKMKAKTNEKYINHETIHHLGRGNWVAIMIDGNISKIIGGGLQ